jgi:cell division transport system permease protein
VSNLLGNIGFLLQESWLNFRRQGLMVVACVSTAAICLTIVGIFGLLAWQVQAIAAALPRRIEVHAFLRPELSRKAAQAVVRKLRALPEVAQVTLVPREQAWVEYRKHYPQQDDLEGMNENPLPDKLEVAATSPKATLELAERVRTWPEVAHVNEGKETLRRLMGVANIVRFVGLALALLLAAGTAAIVANAIRITLFARRRDIRVMQLVGATDDVIRLPFLLEGIVEGAAGGALACLVMGAALHYFTTQVLPNVPFVQELRPHFDTGTMCALLVLGGAALGWAGSVVSIRRFLRAE